MRWKKSEILKMQQALDIDVFYCITPLLVYKYFFNSVVQPVEFRFCYAVTKHTP